LLYNCVGAVWRVLMTVIANAISCLVHMHMKLTDHPRIAREVACSDGVKAVLF
jgi:hypothetical protein